MTFLSDAETATVEDGALDRWRLTLFTRMLAAAALFHLAGNVRSAVTTSPELAFASILLGTGAAAALLAPRRLWGPALLCAAVPATAWYEAPVVGNHWVLAAGLSAVLALSLLTARWSRASAGQAQVWRTFAPAARCTLLVAYGFAAFAKLNSGFLDPVVSCAVYYHNQLVSSWGLLFLQVAGDDRFAGLLPVAAATTEVLIAVTLAVPRCRRLGLVLAASFHWLLAMDLAQHFWDFSAVLFAAFLVFLDDGQAQRLRTITGSITGRGLVRTSLLRIVVITLTAGVVVLNVFPYTPGHVVLVLIGHLAWWLYGTLVLGTVVVLVSAPRRPHAPHALAQPFSVIPLVVPVLVLFNGLTPYLEIKTGFGWNMYSNLRTVAGESNHLLVPQTLPLSDRQEDQVRILASSDPELARLADTGYALVYSEFREYADAHPDASVTYERAGRVVRAERLRHDPAGRGGVSAVERRLRSYRVIDLASSERCQPLFSPAR